MVRRTNWGEDRVFYYDLHGALKSFPANVTDVVEVTPSHASPRVGLHSVWTTCWSFATCSINTLWARKVAKVCNLYYAAFAGYPAAGVSTYCSPSRLIPGYRVVAGRTNFLDTRHDEA